MERQAYEYESLFSRRNFTNINTPPSSIGSILAEYAFETHAPAINPFWPDIRKSAMALCALVLAFAHVTDLSTCNDLPLTCEVVVELPSSTSTTIHLVD